MSFRTAETPAQHWAASARGEGRANDITAMTHHHYSWQIFSLVKSSTLWTTHDHSAGWNIRLLKYSNCAGEESWTSSSRLELSPGQIHLHKLHFPTLLEINGPENSQMLSIVLITASGIWIPVCTEVSRGQQALPWQATFSPGCLSTAFQLDPPMS